MLNYINTYDETPLCFRRTVPFRSPNCITKHTNVCTRKNMHIKIYTNINKWLRGKETFSLSYYILYLRVDINILPHFSIHFPPKQIKSGEIFLSSNLQLNWQENCPNSKVKTIFRFFLDFELQNWSLDDPIFSCLQIITLCKYK